MLPHAPTVCPDLGQGRMPNQNMNSFSSIFISESGPVDIGHANVHNDEIIKTVFNCGYGGPTVLGLDDFISFRVQNRFNHLTVGGLIVDNQDVWFHDIASTINGADREICCPAFNLFPSVQIS